MFPSMEVLWNKMYTGISYHVSFPPLFHSNMQIGSTAEGVHLPLSQSAKFFVSPWRCAPGTPRGQKLEMLAMKFRPPTLTGTQQRTASGMSSLYSNFQTNASKCIHSAKHGRLQELDVWHVSELQKRWYHTLTKTSIRHKLTGLEIEMATTMLFQHV